MPQCKEADVGDDVFTSYTRAKNYVLIGGDTVDIKRYAPQAELGDKQGTPSRCVIGDQSRCCCSILLFIGL